MFNKYNYRPLPKYLTIKESLVDGLGLFANEDIPKYTILGVSHILYNNDLIRTPLGGFINHSEFYNCNILNSLNKINMHYLITTKKVNKNEELLLNYYLTSVAKYNIYE